MDTSLFANGVRADIVDELIRMGELVVISPMAVDQLVSPDTTALREAFTITHVLSGAVQSADGRIKVSVELIDARTNQSIWSARFDRELEAVFAIQDEIAIGVANQLAIKLSAELVDQIGTVPTTSLAAYRLVQRANAVTTRVPRSLSSRRLSPSTRTTPRLTAKSPSRSIKPKQTPTRSTIASSSTQKKPFDCSRSMRPLISCWETCC